MVLWTIASIDFEWHWNFDRKYSGDRSRYERSVHRQIDHNPGHSTNVTVLDVYCITHDITILFIISSARIIIILIIITTSVFNSHDLYYNIQIHNSLSCGGLPEYSIFSCPLSSAILCCLSTSSPFFSVGWVQRHAIYTQPNKY